LIGQQYFALGQLTQTYKILKKKHDNDKKFQMVTIGFFNLVACNSDDAVVVVSNLRWFAFNSLLIFQNMH
jgi:hypothetical protein